MPALPGLGTARPCRVYRETRSAGACSCPVASQAPWLKSLTRGEPFCDTPYRPPWRSDPSDLATPALRAARAFTLIELLIALVVLLIGVYGMLRVFPPGYTAIEAGQQQTTASQLADAELGRWKLDPDALPDAIIATDYDGKVIPATVTNDSGSLRQLLVYGDAARYSPLPLGTAQIADLDRIARPFVYNPADLTPSQFDGAQKMLGSDGKRAGQPHPNWQPNSLYLPRTILGERMDLRTLPQTGFGVPFYLLSHAPVDVLRYEPQSAVPTVGVTQTLSQVYFDIYDARPWHYAPKSADPFQLLEREFTLKTETGQLYFGPGTKTPMMARFFKVDYADPLSRQRVTGVTVKVLSGSIGPGDPTLPLGVDANSIQVYERMNALTAEQYNGYRQSALALKDWPRNGYYVDGESTVSGRILFAPGLQTDPRDTDITVAKADYRVADWQILVFDVEVPPFALEDWLMRKSVAQLTAAEKALLDQLASVSVQLPVGSLKSAGYMNPPRQPVPQEVGRGVRRIYDANGNDVRDLSTWVTDKRSYAYVVAVDRQSGEILSDNELAETGGWPTNPFMRRVRFNVDYKEGLLYFNYSPARVYGYNPDIDTPNRGGRTYRIFCRAQNDWGVQLSLAARQYARSFNGLPGGPPTGANPTQLTYGWRLDAWAERQQIYFPLSEAGQSVAIDYYWDNPTTGRPEFVEGEVHAIGAPAAVNFNLGTEAHIEWVCPLAYPLLTHAANDWGPIAVRGLSVRARSTWVTTGRSVTLQELVAGLAGAPRKAPLQEAWHQVFVSTYLTRGPI